MKLVDGLQCFDHLKDYAKSSPSVRKNIHQQLDNDEVENIVKIEDTDEGQNRISSNTGNNLMMYSPSDLQNTKY